MIVSVCLWESVGEGVLVCVYVSERVRAMVCLFSRLEVSFRLFAFDGLLFLSFFRTSFLYIRISQAVLLYAVLCSNRIRRDLYKRELNYSAILHCLLSFYIFRSLFVSALLCVKRMRLLNYIIAVFVNGFI